MCTPQIFYFLKQKQTCSTLDIKVHDRLLLLALLVLPQRHLGCHTLHHPGHPAQEAGQGVLKNQEIMLFHFGTYFKLHLKARGLCWTATLDHKLPQTTDNTTLHWGANIPISLLKQETVLLKKNKKTISYSLHFLLWTSLCARNFWTMFELAYFLQDELYLNVLYILVPPWLGNAVADLHGQYYSNPKKVPNDI